MGLFFYTTVDLARKVNVLLDDDLFAVHCL